MSEEFDYLSEATPVIDEDSIKSEVNQPAADELRDAAGTDGAEQHRPDSSGNSQGEQYFAQCRLCQQRFRSANEVGKHDCPEEPIAVCRYCKQPHSTLSAADEHLYHCADFRRARVKKKNQEQSHLLDSEVAPQPGQFVAPWYHELKAYVKYDCSDRRSPLQSYDALNSLRKELDIEQRGNLTVKLADEFAGVSYDELTVEFSCKSSGIAPRNDLSPDIEEAREYQIYIYPRGYESHTEAADDGRQRAYFRISPRWPKIVSNSGKKISNPHNLTGFDVEYSGSNIPFKTYPKLLHGAMVRLKDHQGSNRNCPTYLRPDDFHPENIHESSNVVDAELYVRVNQDHTQRVYALDGTLHRISLLLSEERNGYAKSIRDDRECSGHYHAATIGTERTSEMIPGHEWPREHKHYHVKHPKAVEGGPLEHPKISVSLQSSLASNTPKWSQLHQLERELDEALLNLLKWSDIPLRPDHQVYIEDDYFSVESTRRFRKLLHNQLPRIESIQEREVKELVVAGNATEIDINVLETLLTDGGDHSPSSLAEEIGCALSTVYSSIERLGELVHHQYDNVQLTSKYIGQQIVKHIGAVKQTVNTDLKSAVSNLLRAHEFIDADKTNPWSLWLHCWVEDIREHPDSPDELILGYEPTDRKEARRILRKGAGKWAEVTGNDMIDFPDEYIPLVSTRSGETWNPPRHIFQQEMPGYKSRYSSKQV